MTEAATRGWLSKTLSQLFMKRAVITQCEPLGARFRLITLESPQFREFAWQAGQKVQIAMGGAFATRTYTPIEWDANAGRTRILAYAHDTGPGSAWVRSVQTGDECEVFGPRASLDTARALGEIAVFGDETSIGLIHALVRQRPHSMIRGFLEVTSRTEARRVLTRLQLDDAECFEKAADGAHLAEIERRLTAGVGADASFILTGQSLSIQRLHWALKRAGLPAARLSTKAYWAPGKTGLD